MSGVPPHTTSFTVPSNEKEEYGIIAEKHNITPSPRMDLAKRGSRTSGNGPTNAAANIGITVQADNVLYEGLPEDHGMKHKTLTMDKKNNYKEDTAFDALGMDEGKGHKELCLLLWACLISVLVLIALGAAAVALIAIFTGFVDICRCRGTGKRLISATKLFYWL